ncbi:MAG TPA: single-stranded DNA-binding protein [Gemmata sp.]|nr:single-stranded DNA-binding protein [Gemmata sp.]
MATLNKVMLMGRLTDEPKDGAIPTTGTRVVKFSFAVGRSRKNPQTGQWENDPNPLFIDCEAFTRQEARRDLVSLIMQYCHKGDPLYIEGRLQLDRWDDKQSGQKRSKHKIVVENIEFLGGRGEGGSGATGGKPASRSPISEEPDEFQGGGSGENGDHIPF